MSKSKKAVIVASIFIVVGVIIAFLSIAINGFTHNYLSFTNILIIPLTDALYSLKMPIVTGFTATMNRIASPIPANAAPSMKRAAVNGIKRMFVKER